MHKRIYILLLVFATIPIFGQISRENNYKLSFPDNISSNGSFDISLIASNPFTHADKLILYFEPSQRIIFKNLELRTFSDVTAIPCRQINLDGEEAYRAEIDLIKGKISPNNYFQLLFTLKADNPATGNFQFSGLFKAEGQTEGYIQSADNFTAEDTLKFVSADLNFYRSQRFSANSVQLTPGSELNIAPEREDINNLLTEFWIKLSNRQTDFLKIINKQSGETLSDISTNPFQMVEIHSPNRFSRENINPYFLSRGSWYHFSILTSFRENQLNIYCGNTLIAKYSIPSFLNAKSLEWKFENESDNKLFQLDVLRFIDFNNEMGISFSNMNYVNFIGDKAKIIYQFNFDNEEELYAAQDQMSITYNSLNFQKSDAPIFARAPELNIHILSNIYELTWSGGDYKQAKWYLLEKSVNNSDFQQVESTRADDSYEKKYSLFDARDASADIIYYRIKQVNTDGSVVYSSQVKIGQGITEPFIVEQNYPNPFNPRTSIVVDLLEDSDVEITVYNLEGKEISKLFKGFLTKGNHKFSFDASELSSGIYLYKVSTPDYSDTKKMILTK